MKLDLRYHGLSGLRDLPGGAGLRFATNVARLPVAFDGELVQPLRFREAISALHEVVVGDLRRKPKDRGAHTAWLASQAAEEQALREAVGDRARQQVLARGPGGPVPANLEADFRRQHSLYWTARRAWAVELGRNDPALFRALVPCDPVVTVAPDVVTFECFSKDEASYGCLSVDREGFRPAAEVALGTTNVDYSLALYEHFQTIRTYRPTRLQVDPGGISAAIGAAPALREEKIDLPPSWLRGFGQLQAAMALPAHEVQLSTDVVYSLLAYLRRHRERTGPRALKFVLQPGRPVQIVIEPWGVTLTSRAAPYAGERATEVKVWGRRRLMAFARVLPLTERFDVRLLGTGLPSVWIARMGELRLTLALSGWTTNDWARGSNLDTFFARYTSLPATVDKLARELASAHVATLATLMTKVAEPPATVLGSLFALARRGQVVFDFAIDAYRWRPLLDVPVTDAMLGPEPEETVAGRRLAGAVKLERTEVLDGGRRALIAKVGDTSCEAVLDGDGALGRAKCTCSYFHRFRLRAGPCRHLLALRMYANRPDDSALPVARVVTSTPRRPS